MKVKRTERGYAGHFICSASCMFRRNTLIEYGKKKIVVSTVGNMRTGNTFEKIETIGHNRYYETMAFWADYQEPYWEANIQKQITFKSQWAIDKVEQRTDLDADNMHEKVVNELMKKIIYLKQ